MTLQGVPFLHMFLCFPDYLTSYETQKLIGVSVENQSSDDVR